MPKLYVKCAELRYGGRSLRYGDLFDASDKDAKVLKLIGKASDTTDRPPLRVADPQPARAPRVEQQASMLAEGEPVPTGRRRRRYLRSDMQSED